MEGLHDYSHTTLPFYQNAAIWLLSSFNKLCCHPCHFCTTIRFYFVTTLLYLHHDVLKKYVPSITEQKFFSCSLSKLSFFKHKLTSLQ